VDRRTRNLFLLALAVLVVLTAGAATILSGSTPAVSTPPPDTTAVVGVIVAVDARTLTDVRSFDLRTASGQIMTFGLSELQNGVQFPPGHLAEHKLTAAPVRVWYRSSGGQLLAIRLEDAP
jgi:hypothetical protein